MKRFHTVLFGFTILFSGLLSSCAQQNDGKIANNSIRVQKVVDGKTLKMSDGFIVSLVGVNCAEKNETARSLLKKMTEGELVRIEHDDIYDKSAATINSGGTTAAYVCPGSERASKKYVDGLMGHFGSQVKRNHEKMANLMSELAPTMKQQYINTLNSSCIGNYNATLVQLGICTTDNTVEFSKKGSFLALEQSRNPGTYLVGTASGEFEVREQQIK